MTRWPTGFPPSSHPSNLPPGSWITRARHDSRRQYPHIFGFPTSRLKCKLQKEHLKLIKTCRVFFPEYKTLELNYGRAGICVICRESGASAIFSVLQGSFFKCAMSDTFKSDWSPKLKNITYFWQRNMLSQNLHIYDRETFCHLSSIFPQML